jgi:hypothetical protein
MLDTVTRNQPDLSSYPTSGVVVGINHHPQALGGHRIRLGFDPKVVKILGRGLYSPRLHFNGTFVNGLRIWCEQEGGMAPIASGKVGSWAVTIPVRRLRGREAVIGARDVPIKWELDDTGPVLIIPRLPDVLLPEPVIDKLPNSQVDPETRFERADKRLRREVEEAIEQDRAQLRVAEQLLADSTPPQSAVTPDAIFAEQGTVYITEAKTPEAPQPSAPAVDLKAALQMVNELVDQLGAEVVLSIDERGHVQAKRRIVQYIDL